MRFLAKEKGYRRHSTHLALGGQTVAGLLQNYGHESSDNKEFICHMCFNHLKAISKHQAIFLERQKRKDGPKPLMVMILNCML